MKRAPLTRGLACIAALLTLCLLPLSAQAPTNPSVIIWVGADVDSSGTSHDAAVFVPASIQIDYIGQTVGIQVYEYASVSAFRATLTGTKSFTPIGQHSYTIPKARFQAVAGEAVNGTVASGIFQVCAEEVNQTLDTPTTNTDGTPKLDADGKPVLETWVAGATMKRLDLVTGALTAYP